MWTCFGSVMVSLCLWLAMFVSDFDFFCEQVALVFSNFEISYQQKLLHQVADWLWCVGRARDFRPYFTMGIQPRDLWCLQCLRRCSWIFTSWSCGFGVACVGDTTRSSCFRSMCTCNLSTSQATGDWTWSCTREWRYIWGVFLGWFAQRLASLSKERQHYGHPQREESLGNWSWGLARFFDVCGIC